MARIPETENLNPQCQTLGRRVKSLAGQTRSALEGAKLYEDGRVGGCWFVCLVGWWVGGWVAPFVLHVSLAS
jgi:hypothetical protein